MNRNDLPVHLGHDQGSEIQSEQFRGGGPAGFRDNRAPELGVDWRRIKLALIRQLPLIVLVTALGTAAGFALSTMIDPEYQAEATLLVGSSGGGGGGAGGNGQDGPIRSGALLQGTEWLDLLNTFTVLEEVAEDQKLFLSYREPSDSIYFRDFSIRDGVVGGNMILRVDETGENYILLDVEEQILEEGRLGNQVGVFLGLWWRPPALPPRHEIEFSVSNVREASEGLRSDLTTSMDARGSFLRIRLSGTDPVRVAETVNSIATSFVSFADSMKKETIAQTRATLATQLDSARIQLDGSSASLQFFLEENITTPTEGLGGAGAGQDPTTSFFTNQQRRDALSRQIDDIDSALSRRGADDGLIIDAFETIPAVQTSSVMTALLTDLAQQRDSLRILRRTYEDSFIGVQEVIENINALEQSSIPVQARALMDQLQTEADGLDARLRGQTTNLRDIPARARREADLRSAVTSDRALLEGIQSSYDATVLAEATVIGDLAILDSATIPRRPVSNTTVQLLAMAIVGSLGLAIFGALFLDRIDSRIRYPEQVTYGLGLNILGAVPRGRRKTSGKFKNSNEVLEAFRSLRLNLIHAHNQSGPLVMTVTSPDPGDGKSFVTSNLAWVFASLGQRTLVIDGDTRRGTLHRLLEVERKPGLTDYLSGRVSAEELIVPSQKQHVHVIPSGARIGHSPELLSSNAMVRLVNDMRERYQVILIDSPPLRAGVDPLALATITENLLIVLRSGVSDQEIVETKLQLLDQLPVRVLGAVLNSLAPRGHGYKQYTYLSDYGVDGEEETEVEILPPLPAR